MSPWTMGLSLLAALYLGTVLGAYLQCDHYQVPYRHRWVILRWPLTLPSIPAWFMIHDLAQAPASIQTAWAQRSLPCKVIAIATLYGRTLSHLPAIIRYAALILAQGETLSPAIIVQYLTEIPRPHYAKESSP